MVGLEPTKAVRPGDLQSPAIATMRHAQIGTPSGIRTRNTQILSLLTLPIGLWERIWYCTRESNPELNLRRVV